MEKGGVLPPAFPTPEGQRGPLHSQAPRSANPPPAPAGLTRPLSLDIEASPTGVCLPGQGSPDRIFQNALTPPHQATSSPL